MDDIAIKLSVLQKLPRNIVAFVGHREAKDIDGVAKEAVIVLMQDDRAPHVIRKCYFDIETGDYMGDTA